MAPPIEGGLWVFSGGWFALLARVVSCIVRDFFPIRGLSDALVVVPVHVRVDVLHDPRADRLLSPCSEWTASVFIGPRSPPAAGLSGGRPLLPMERMMPCSRRGRGHPGRRRWRPRSGCTMGPVSSVRVVIALCGMASAGRASGFNPVAWASVLPSWRSIMGETWTLPSRALVPVVPAGHSTTRAGHRSGDIQSRLRTRSSRPNTIKPSRPIPQKKHPQPPYRRSSLVH